MGVKRKTVCLSPPTLLFLFFLLYMDKLKRVKTCNLAMFLRLVYLVDSVYGWMVNVVLFQIDQRPRTANYVLCFI